MPARFAVAELLKARTIELLPQTAFGITPVEETGTTFLQNALLKARHAAALAGLAALADDSGLEVDALGGRPGCGPHAMPAGRERRRQRGAAAARTAGRAGAVAHRALPVRARLGPPRPDPHPIVGVGSWEGRILAAPLGTGGFGYDPVFQPEGAAVSVAELPPEQKNSCSHRAQALRALLAALP